MEKTRPWKYLPGANGLAYFAGKSVTMEKKFWMTFFHFLLIFAIMSLHPSSGEIYKKEEVSTHVKFIGGTEGGCRKPGDVFHLIYYYICTLMGMV
jgi:hypothetical protein